VADRRRHRAVRGLAGADRLDIRPRYHLDVHFRHLAETQDRIFAPGVAGDAVRIEANPFLQHPARHLDRAAFDLVDDAVGIDGFADIHRKRQTLDPDFLADFDLG